MNVYMYKASLLCEGCGEMVKKELDAAGKSPADPGDECSYDSDNYPKGPFSNGGGEADSPNHCDMCQVFLENPLTTDGINYVIAAAQEERHGDDEVIKEWLTYYDYIEIPS
jgi:hypothetical protein